MHAFLEAANSCELNKKLSKMLNPLEATGEMDVLEGATWK
jgi:hypothetical protein